MEKKTLLFQSVGFCVMVPEELKENTKRMTLFLKMKKAVRELQPSVLFSSVTLLILLQLPLSWVRTEGSFLFGILLLEWGFLFGGAWVLARQSQFSSVTLFPLCRPTGKEIIHTVVLTLALGVLIDHLLFLTDLIFPPGPEIKAAMDSLMEVAGWPAILGQSLLICVTPAICEEFFFRGLFQQGLLRNQWSTQKVMGATAFAFAILHGVPHYWHLYFVMGLFLCWLMTVAKNLWIPIIAHFINNAWTFANHLVGNEVTKWDWNVTLIFCIAAVIFAVALRSFPRKRESGKESQE